MILQFFTTGYCDAYESNTEYFSTKVVYYKQDL
jgi:hypothetical protein